MKEEKRKEEVAKRFQTLFMPKAIKDASFDNFNVNNLTRQKIYKFANDFANPNVKPLTPHLLTV